jgi:arylsulfatase A-like enzyme
MKKILFVVLTVFAIVGICLLSLGIGAKLITRKPNLELSDTPIQILPPDHRPNIVLINLDDADHKMLSPEMLKLYPGFDQLAKRSVSFTNMHVTTPFCGPSRAALFRGQYAHRTGVRVNIPESELSLQFKGGYAEFMRQGHDHEELGVWLKRGGYRTMLLGKYHHNGFDGRKPDGFDDFYATNGGRYLGSYEFTTRKVAKGRGEQNEMSVYRTNREADDAVHLIRQHTQRRKLQTASGEVAQPFFFYYAPLAPHRPLGNDFTKMVDKKKYANWQANLKIPMTPDFNEADMFDKPTHRQSEPYSDDELEELHAEYRSRARAVKSVDDFIVKMINELKDRGLYENTYFMITSDNGYQMGHHRLHNKLDPYRMSTTAPLFVSGPEAAAPTSVGHLLAHIDMCPTILDLAECPKPGFLDGKSFVDLIRDPHSHDEKTWRKPVVLENWQVKRNRSACLPGTYSGLRYYDRTYVEWCTGDREFYDLSADPYELENAYDSLSDLEKNKLREDLLNSRSVEMDPIVTVLKRAVLSEHTEFPYCVRGIAEDDRCVKKIELMIRHEKRGYWNGESWIPNKKRTYMEVTDFAPDQQMVSWRYDIRDAVSQLTKKDMVTLRNGKKAFRLAVQVFAYDHLGNKSEEARTQMVPPFTTDPFSDRTATEGQTIKR